MDRALIVCGNAACVGGSFREKTIAQHTKGVVGRFMQIRLSRWRKRLVALVTGAAGQVIMQTLVMRVPLQKGDMNRIGIRIQIRIERFMVCGETVFSF